MTTAQKIWLTVLRISLGWLFFYAGVTKIVNPAWSAAGYLRNAKAFGELYQWLASPGILPITNFVNEWGLTLLGVSLILGIGVRLASILGAALMLLYYAPLGFPYPSPNSLVVDEHVVYAAALLYLAAVRAGRVWGLESWCANLPICRRFPALRTLIG
ncbi:DoxX family protein [Candidatus Parcubacteria bacterium]|nr:MAG: DoxX family protein [Candidatus Parcubacteria bacterium]